MAKLNKKDQEFLDNLKQAEEQEDRVVIPTFSVNARKGVYNGYVNGEEVVLDNPFTVTPLFLYTKFMRRSKAKSENFKVLSETIMAPQNTRGITYYDTEGTTMCGRTPNAQVPESWTEEEKEANKAKASYYGILYAVHSQYGLIRLQLPAAKAVVLSNFLDDLGLDLLAKADISVKLTDDGFVSFNVEKTNNDISSELVDAMRTAKENVDNYNKYVMARHNKATGGGVEIQDSIGVGDLDDEIPF